MTHVPAKSLALRLIGSRPWVAQGHQGGIKSNGADALVQPPIFLVSILRGLSWSRPVEVERTFAWLDTYRHLSKDYDYLPESSEAVIQLAIIDLMAHRLTPR